MANLPHPIRPLRWVGSSSKDYAEFPPEGQEQFGFELFLAQTGQHPPSGKPLRGPGGAIELIEDFRGDAYRAVYTLRLRSAIFVLRAFKKKSKEGIKTPQKDVMLIKRRLDAAEADDAIRMKEDKQG
jgi:phage-related protein